MARSTTFAWWWYSPRMKKYAVSSWQAQQAIAMPSMMMCGS